MIRYHSFYPYGSHFIFLLSVIIHTLILYSWHREGAYGHLTNQKDLKALEAVRAFNPYDLYSKSDDPCDPAELRPYYEELIAKYFPAELDW